MKKTRQKIIILILVLSLSVALLGCDQEEVTEEESYNTSVNTVTVKLSDLTSYFETTGELEAGEVADVAPKVGEKVKSVRVKMGDNVSAGQALMVLDSSGLMDTIEETEVSIEAQRAGLESQQASIESQKSSLEVTRSSVSLQEQDLADEQLNYNRQKQLFESQVISQSEMDSAQSALNKAKLNLEMSQAQLAQSSSQLAQTEASYRQSQISIQQLEVSLANLKEDLADYTVISPINGQVSKVNVNVGEIASAQATAFELVGLSSMKVKVSVSENVISQVKEGLAINIDIPALNKSVTGKVLSISPTMDNTTKSFPVEISIANEQGDMKVGMVAKLKLASDSSTSAYVLPIDAVLEKEGRYYVYVVDENSIANEVNVEVGLMSDNLIEIISGLSLGDEVILDGNQLVKDGQKVIIAEEK